MELGTKLKNARVNKDISQKDAADKIGITRQTLSNWENGKTYPDIVSLINLSDLYCVSLDTLLKEENKTSDYVDYIDKAINAIKNKRKVYKWIEIGVYLVLLVVYILMYWLNASNELRTGISITMRSFLIPSVILILSLLIGIDKAWGSKRWFLILFFSVTLCFAEQFTTMLDIFADDMYFYLFSFLSPANYSSGAFLSFIGLGIGALARKFKTRSVEKETTDEEIVASTDTQVKE